MCRAVGVRTNTRTHAQMHTHTQMHTCKHGHTHILTRTCMPHTPNAYCPHLAPTVSGRPSTAQSAVGRASVTSHTPFCLFWTIRASTQGHLDTQGKRVSVNEHPCVCVFVCVYVLVCVRASCLHMAYMPESGTCSCAWCACMCVVCVYVQIPPSAPDQLRAGRATQQYTYLQYTYLQYTYALLWIPSCLPEKMQRDCGTKHLHRKHNRLLKFSFCSLRAYKHARMHARIADSTQECIHTPLVLLTQACTYARKLLHTHSHTHTQTRTHTDTHKYTHRHRHTHSHKCTHANTIADKYVSVIVVQV
jgi:hypothetical protein